METKNEKEQAPSAEKPKRRRGFAAMDAARQREISSKGGKAAHQKGTAHEFSADEAREAGRKGGIAISKDKEHMARIGREGGRARGKHRAPEAENESQATAGEKPKSNAA